MNTPTTHATGHSAEVRIHLVMNGRVLPVAQLGPAFLVLRTPTDHPACEAEVVLSIDGRESRWAVSLPDGIQAGRRKTALSSRAADGAGSPLSFGHGGKAVENGRPALPG